MLYTWSLLSTEVQLWIGFQISVPVFRAFLIFPTWHIRPSQQVLAFNLRTLPVSPVSKCTCPTSVSLISIPKAPSTKPNLLQHSHHNVTELTPQEHVLHVPYHHSCHVLGMSVTVSDVPISSHLGDAPPTYLHHWCGHVPQVQIKQHLPTTLRHAFSSGFPRSATNVAGVTFISWYNNSLFVVRSWQWETDDIVLTKQCGGWDVAEMLVAPLRVQNALNIP